MLCVCMYCDVCVYRLSVVNMSSFAFPCRARFQASGGKAGNGFRAILKLCFLSRVGLAGAGAGTGGEVGNVTVAVSRGCCCISG